MSKGQGSPEMMCLSIGIRDLWSSSKESSIPGNSVRVKVPDMSKASFGCISS